MNARLLRAVRWALVGGVCVFGLVSAVDALRIVNYNLTNYPGPSVSVRNPRFRTIMAPLGADIVVCQEVTSSAGVDSFRINVLNRLEPGQWSSAPFVNGNDTDNALFYKHGKVSLLASWHFYPNPDSALRLVSVYRMRPVGYTASGAEFRVYSQHLKASQGFEEQRLSEAIGIRDSMNAIPPGGHGILLGDFNIYTSTEPAYQKLLQVQADNDGRVYDPLNAPGNWHDNAGFAAIHTQCPCLTCPPGFGFAGGGLDDRFDQLLPTLNFNNGTGFEIVPGSYKAVGNDAQHFNKDINAAPVIPEGQAYADALWGASDHLPVRMDISVPSEITVPAALAFGTVIVGASASQSLSVTNGAVAPADDLDYSITADAGFGAPVGNFELLPAASTLHSITMSTGTSGAKSGQAHVASDAVDTPLVHVNLSGTVLDHAAASLDSVAAVVSSGLDFGAHAAGEFTDRTVRVHNLGYDALQARLALTGASITGPAAARFSIVGGFTPSLVAGVGRTLTLHFDDTGAPDSVYAATLTFTSTDEPLPGALPQPNLVVSLQATVSAATDATSDRPLVTRLFAPSPNPPGPAGTVLRFDVASASELRLEVFDVAGRRVSALASGSFAPGIYRRPWDGRDGSGRPLAAGVYFARLTVTGRAPETVRITWLR